MSFQQKASKSSSLFPILISFLLVLSHGFINITTAAETKTTTIGAIIDTDSRMGKEQKIAMEIAVEKFNNNSTKNKLALLNVQNHGREPLQAAYAAEKLIKNTQVQVIVGMETWQQSALVADLGNRAQVPVLSLAASAITPPLASLRWPFLVQIAPNASQQVNCIAAILQSYKWKRVIAISEDDIHGGDSGMMALFSEAIQSSGSEIEHRLIFPPLSTLSDPKGFVHEELINLLQRKCRVFIVLQSSLSLVTHLFREAKRLGLVGRDSVWIISDTVSSLLDSVDSSVISSMQGALGIQAYYPEKSKSFLEFEGKFEEKFRAEYPEEENSRPGIQAVRAFDSIKTVSQAVQKLESNKNMITKLLLENILSSDFMGLSGDIRFYNGELTQFPIFRIVNVVGKGYEKLGFWSPKIGFSESASRSGDGSESMKLWEGKVIWPGKLKQRAPKGWVMPTEAEPMRIVIPGNTVFEKFVKVDWAGTSQDKYTGFCIDIFEEVLKVLKESYLLHYEFYPVNGTYDALVESVSNKTYDAVVGDITILAERWKHVEFTQPYAESGLSMIVQVRPDDHKKAWMFMKPFTKEMWTVTGAVMVYTMFIVWFLEHQSNPEFRGPWKNQISTALWFTFNSLFFSHREKVQSNHTKVVVVVWLFVVFVVTSSYTASLTSMLTVPRLEPNVTDIAWLKNNNATVGCDGDSFVEDYLKNVLNFSSRNIKNISSQYDYPEEFKKGHIQAAFLELPYEKVFLKEYCNGYTSSGQAYRFGGLGFAFQKGSPIANDVSEAILTISENGKLKDLEQKWFTRATTNCSTTTNQVDSLNLHSFWGLYIICCATSTICLMFSLVRLLRNYQSHIQASPDNIFSPSRNNLWRKIARFARYFYSGGTQPHNRAPSIADSENVWSSAKWELVSPSEILGHNEASRPPEIEIPIRTTI